MKVTKLTSALGVGAALVAGLIAAPQTFADANYISGIDESTMRTWMENTGGGFKDYHFFDCILATYMLNNNLASDEMIAYVQSNGGELTVADFENITTLECNAKDITNTSGIGRLTKLAYLRLMDNQISNIDLTQNTRLKELRLSDNPIDGINLVENSLLEFLDIMRTNIDTVDVSNATGLTKLLADNVVVTTYSRARKIGDKYEMEIPRIELGTELSTIRYWSPVASDKYAYDPNTSMLTTSDRDAIIGSIHMTADGANVGLSVAPVTINYCSWSKDYKPDHQCIFGGLTTKIIGEAWDSNEFLPFLQDAMGDNYRLKEIIAHGVTNMDDFGMSSESTATHAFGIIPNNDIRTFWLSYEFETKQESDTDSSNTADEENKINAPDTGLLTKNDEGGKTATPIILSVGFALLAVGSVAYFINCRKNKVSFKKH